MKSNEEFIAGIYEKAAAYTEEKETKIRKISQVSKAGKVAAMVAVCLGLAGIGSLVFGKQEETPDKQGEEYGIALLSEDDAAGMSIVLSRTLPGEVTPLVLPELTVLTGIVEQVDYENCIIWLRLGENEKLVQEQLPMEQRALVPVKWELTELPEEITVGASISAGGATVYTGLPAGADWMLVVSDLERFSLWIEETGVYRNLGNGKEY